MAQMLVSDSTLEAAMRGALARYERMLAQGQGADAVDEPDGGQRRAARPSAPSLPERKVGDLLPPAYERIAVVLKYLRHRVLDHRGGAWPSGRGCLWESPSIFFSENAG
jgi:hypothetical protein